MASGAMWCAMIVVATVALGGCGGSRESAAAAACEAAAKERSQGKLLAVDLEALAASAVPEGAGQSVPLPAPFCCVVSWLAAS